MIKTELITDDPRYNGLTRLICEECGVSSLIDDDIHHVEGCQAQILTRFLRLNRVVDFPEAVAHFLPFFGPRCVLRATILLMSLSVISNCRPNRLRPNSSASCRTRRSVTFRAAAASVVVNLSAILRLRQDGLVFVLREAHQEVQCLRTVFADHHSVCEVIPIPIQSTLGVETPATICQALFSVFFEFELFFAGLPSVLASHYVALIRGGDLWGGWLQAASCPATPINGASKGKPEKEKRINLTAERQAEYEAWHEAVRGTGQAMLPRLRSLPPSELHALMLSADPHLEQWPVYQTGDKRYAMPLWDAEGMTGAQLVALVVFGFWLYYGESAHMVGGSIMGDWGEVIKAVV